MPSPHKDIIRLQFL